MDDSEEILGECYEMEFETPVPCQRLVERSDGRQDWRVLCAL